MELYRKIAGQDHMKETITKVLGLRRDIITDQFMIDNKNFDNSMTATTQRLVLTKIASLFEPLDENFSSKLADQGKRMGRSVEKRGH